MSGAEHGEIRGWVMGELLQELWESGWGDVEENCCGTPQNFCWTRVGPFEAVKPQLRGMGYMQSQGFSVSDIPGSTVCSRRAENEVGAQGATQSAPPPDKGGKRSGESARWFPHR